MSKSKLEVIDINTGLTLEQVDELYGLVDKAWKSKDFRPMVSFREAEVQGDNTTDLRQMSIAQSERRASQAQGDVSYGKET